MKYASVGISFELTLFAVNQFLCGCPNSSMALVSQGNYKTSLAVAHLSTMDD